MQMSLAANMNKGLMIIASYNTFRDGSGGRITSQGSSSTAPSLRVRPRADDELRRRQSGQYSGGYHSIRRVDHSPRWTGRTRVRICVTAKHRYPAGGTGPSGGHVFDLLVRGLAESGHEVFYRPQLGAAAPLPPGVGSSSSPCGMSRSSIAAATKMCTARRNAAGSPGSHLPCRSVDDLGPGPKRGDRATGFTSSQTLARTYGSDRFVRTASIRASSYFRSDQGRLSALHLDVAIRQAEGAGHRPCAVAARRVFAWWSPAPATTTKSSLASQRQCGRPVWSSWVRWSASRRPSCSPDARALLFPTELNEGFGLVLAEAMVSGTPVICSDNGACPEIVTPDVGFVCCHAKETIAGTARLDEIRPRGLPREGIPRFPLPADGGGLRHASTEKRNRLHEGTRR